jgi:hypothetical protein
MNHYLGNTWCNPLKTLFLSIFATVPQAYKLLLDIQIAKPKITLKKPL